MRSKKTDFVVGFVITASIAILIFGIIYLKEYSVGKKTQTVYALFTDIGTLTNGDPVKINGVKMGKVVSVVLKGNQVLVGMEIDANVVIPSDSKVTIQNVGLMGERMIGFRLGNSPAPVDPAVPLQGFFDSGVAEAMGMLGDVFVDAKSLVLEIRRLMDETVASEEFLRTFKQVTGRLDRLTVAIDRMVAGNEQTVNTIIKDVNSTTSDLKGFMNDNMGKMDTIVNNISYASDKAKGLTKKAEDITKKIDAILAKINADDGTLNQILKDKELYGMLKSTVTEADSLLKAINKTGKLKVKIGF
jgi:phospholipid/cholesterol/gamma-HCH transport system substrate-binding protein